MMQRCFQAFLGITLITVVVLTSACGSTPDTSTSSVNDLSSIAPEGFVNGIGLAGRSSLGFIGANVGSQQVGVWVNGVGTVVTEPDIANLSLGVEAKSATVSKARNQAAVAMTAVVDFLTANGVAARDIRTESFNISPQYTYKEKVDSNGFRTNQRVLTGYQVANTASVKVRDLDQVGSLLDGAVKAGRDLVRVNGIRFSVDNPDPLKVQARELAVQQALQKAQELTISAGVGLGRLVYISESSSTPIYNVVEAARADFPGASSFASTPINAGESQIQVTVQAVFAIQ
jgi:uncharacterized protein YggE